MTVPPALVPGARVADRFDLVDALGADGLGAAFHAVDAVAGCEVVLRVFPVGVLPTAERALLHAEVEAAARVAHPNVAPTLAFGSDDAAGVDWVAEARAPGETLATLLAARGTPPRPLAMRLLHEAVAGIAAVHREGMVHGDLHPGNVFLARVQAERRVRVQVTGLGQRRGRVMPRTGMPSVPRYAAPERLRRDAVLTPATDVFGLGVMAYELLAGLPPQWNQALMAMARGQAAAVPSPVELRPDIPTALAEVVLGALEADPLRRFLDADDFAAALARAAAPEAVPTVSAQPSASPVVAPPAVPRKVPEVVVAARTAVVAGDLSDALYIPPTMATQREGSRVTALPTVTQPIAAPPTVAPPVVPPTVVQSAIVPSISEPPVAALSAPAPPITAEAPEAATVEPPSPAVEQVVEKVSVASAVVPAPTVVGLMDAPQDEAAPPAPRTSVIVAMRDEERAETVPAPPEMAIPAVARGEEAVTAAPTPAPPTAAVPVARRPRIAPPSSNRSSPFLVAGGAIVALLVGGGIWASVPTPGEIALAPENVAQKLAVSAPATSSDAPASAVAPSLSAAAATPAVAVAPPAERRPQPAREQPQAQRPTPAPAAVPPAARTSVSAPPASASPSVPVQTPAPVAPVPAPSVQQTAQAAPRMEVERSTIVSTQAAAPVSRPAANRVFRLNEVERRPTLSNQAEIRRALARTPPPAVAAGASVEATVRFVVGEDGRIDLGTLSVMEATHDNVAGHAARVLARARFAPGRVDGQAVRTEVVMPITWQPD